MQPIGHAVGRRLRARVAGAASAVLVVAATATAAAALVGDAGQTVLAPTDRGPTAAPGTGAQIGRMRLEQVPAGYHLVSTEAVPDPAPWAPVPRAVRLDRAFFTTPSGARAMIAVQSGTLSPLPSGDPVGFGPQARVVTVRGHRAVAYGGPVLQGTTETLTWFERPDLAVTVSVSSTSRAVDAAELEPLVAELTDQT